jgi:hypothetical protein
MPTAFVVSERVPSFRFEFLGKWDERYGHLRTTPVWDVGLRLIRAELPPGRREGYLQPRRGLQPKKS